jgi:endonuclease G
MQRPPSIPPQVEVAVIVLFFIGLIAVGAWLARRPDHSRDWAWSPVTPGHYSGSSEGFPPPPASVRLVPRSIQMLLGNPSDAREDTSDRDNYLMVKPYFSLAYDNSAGEPRWVSWRLCASDLGDAPRKPDFDPDKTLPGVFDVIESHDYSESGFDRGHMCDHSDRAASLESSYATFVMTNIVPQAPNNNRKCWDQLETYCRELARSGDRLYITAGPAGEGGVGTKGPAATIAHGRVTVPAETWKIIVVTPDTGRDDLSNVSVGDRVIAVNVPNDQNKCGDEWAGFRCSPATIESETGLHFFSALPATIRSTFENEVDDKLIPPPRPINHYEN